MKTIYAGCPDVRASMSINAPKPMPGNLPLTFPCQGTTSVAYLSNGEMPSPPNTSGPWGTPVVVAGNPSDTVVLQSSTMTDNAGHTIGLQLLSSANDPNKLLPAFEAVAYLASPLQPNTQYLVSLTGAINGTPFSCGFTFTTGNVVACRGSRKIYRYAPRSGRQRARAIGRPRLAETQTVEINRGK